MSDKKEKEEGSEESDKEPQSCDECGGTLLPEKIKLEEFEGGKLYVINEAPVMACQSCGAIWVPETIIGELEQMIEVTRRRSMLKLRKITKLTHEKPIKKGGKKS